MSESIMSRWAAAEDLDMDISLFDVFEEEEGIDTDRAISVMDAYIKCMNKYNCIDVRWISDVSGADIETVANELRIRNLAYRDPSRWKGSDFEGLESADTFLSGYVLKRLTQCKIANMRYEHIFDKEIEALESILPPSLTRDEIYVSLASPWLPEDIVVSFINYLLKPHKGNMCEKVIHDKETGSWNIPEKGRLSWYVRGNAVYGTSRISAVHIIEKTLNEITICVKDKVISSSNKSGEKYVINQAETAEALEKQKLILEEFNKWIWSDPDRAKRIKRQYYRTYASIVPRHFNGEFLAFPGMSESIQLRNYQKNAVARILSSPNTLLAHDVGAGKTYIMIASAMKLRQLGLAKKPMFVVPNNLVGQWAEMFACLYPEANVLVITDKDFKGAKRQELLGYIRDNEFDGIIIPYSKFDAIPFSRDFYVKKLTEERDKLQKVNDNKENVTPELKSRIERLNKKIGEAAVSIDQSKHYICFDELGIDRLYVDEAHNYKNLPLETSITGVYGISKTGSAKCTSMMNKVYQIQKENSGGGIVMATATPITNSISDIYVFQKYLQSGELELLDLQTFDSWIGMFAEKTTEFEIAVDTNNYRLTTRFSKFHNIPELTNILSSIADFHALDDSDGLPEFNGYTDIVIPRSYAQKAYYERISERADKVHRNKVSRKEDNMLMITGDGRKASLDIRLVDPKEGGEGRTKVSECAERVALIYHRTHKDRMTQLVFCDQSTPKAGFNIYDDLKSRLIDFGVKPEEIAYIHDAKTEAKRKKMFEKMRKGEIRVLIGSTFKLGLGVNVQDRLCALHHLDIPWRPADMVQREGRILRKGNMNKRVEIFRYIVEKSFDSYSWQILETKQEFITNILSGTVGTRSGAEVDETVLDYAEVKALALGNDLLRKRVKTSIEISKTELLRKQSLSNRAALENKYRKLPKKIEECTGEYMNAVKDSEFVSRYTQHVEMNNSSAEKAVASEMRRRTKERIAEAVKNNKGKSCESSLMSYRGFFLILPAHMDPEQPYIYVIREGKYRVNLSDKEDGMIIRIDNFIDKLAKYCEDLHTKLDLLKKEQTEILEELSKPDVYADKLEELKAELNSIDAELGVKMNA